MTRFTPDFEGTAAGFPVYPRSDYEVKAVNVKGLVYMKTPEEGDEYEVAGVRVTLEMVGQIGTDGSIITTLDGKDISGEKVTPFTAYVHSADAWPIAKRFAMAFYGYDLDTEEDFNLFIIENSLDFGVDGDIGEDGRASEVEIGDGWKGLVGKRARVTLSSRVFAGRQQQDHQNFMPIK